MTGWAVYGGGELLASGFERLAKPGAPARARLRRADSWLVELLAPVAWGRGDVAYEAPMVRGRNHAATRSALHLEAALLLASSRLGIPEERIHAYHLSTLKKSATGSGRATKDQVIGAMRVRWGLPQLEDDNESDALSALHHHIQTGA